MRMDSWLTPYQAAVELDVSLAVITRSIQQGRLKATRVGGNTMPYIHRNDFEAFKVAEGYR